ncbi:MAG: hypothetical protein KDA51_06615 [Planctomycetales bacterium]|nr:hypothetical protein [Planctomycetales bacterium]
MNQTKFAELIGVTPQRVSQLVQIGMAGVTWHGGRGKGTFIEPGKAIPWLKENGYAMNPDSRRSEDPFTNLGSLSADLASIQSDERDATTAAAIDGIWSAWRDAADELAESFELDAATAWDAAATVLVVAHHAACKEARIPSGIPKEVEARMIAGYPGPSE